MQEPKELPQQVLTLNSTPDYTIRFYSDENKEIGCIDFSEGVLKFTGEAEPSAQVFFEHVLKPLVDKYIRDENEKCTTTYSS